MLETAVVLLALALIGCAVWIARLSGARARLAAERDAALQRVADTERAAALSKEAFGALAHEALQKNTEQLVRLNEQALAARASTAVAEMEKRKAAVDQLLQPIGEALKKTQEELRKIEGERVSAYAGLKAQVAGVQSASEQLRAETARLAQALSNPNVRGQYGEIQLQRVAELAGMREYCDFSTQESQRGVDGRLLRPDMLVRYPNGRVIAVDAKTNISGYLDALNAPTAEQAEPHLQRFAQHVVEQVQALGKKGYWRELAESPELVVMYVPGDQFLDAAFARRPDLIELAARANVVLASPSTFIGLLRAVHVGWREKRLEESAQQLFQLARELHDRLKTAFGHLSGIAGAVETTTKRFNDFVGSLSGRVLPTLRKIEDAGVALDEAQRIAEPRQVEVALRELPSDVAARPAAPLPSGSASDATRGEP